MFKAPLPAKQAGRTPAANLQGRLKRNSRSKTLQQREDEHLCRQRPPPRGGDGGRGAAGDVQDKEAGAGTMARAGHPAGGELPLKFVAPPKGAGRPGAPRGSLAGGAERHRAIPKVCAVVSPGRCPPNPRRHRPHTTRELSLQPSKPKQKAGDPARAHPKLPSEGSRALRLCSSASRKAGGQHPQRPSLRVNHPGP